MWVRLPPPAPFFCKGVVMPQSAIIMLIFGGILIFAAIIFSVFSLKNVHQYFKKEIDGHIVEIKTGFRTADLIIDGKIVDQFSTINSSGIKLTGKVGEKVILVNIGGGFVKLRIYTFVDGVKDSDLSNI